MVRLESTALPVLLQSSLTPQTTSLPKGGYCIPAFSWCSLPNQVTHEASNWQNLEHMLGPGYKLLKYPWESEFWILPQMNYNMKFFSRIESVPRMLGGHRHEKCNDSYVWIVKERLKL